MISVLLTGGTGALGLKIIQHSPSNWNLHAPTSLECNILNEESVKLTIETHRPNIIIHTAAYVDTFGCEQNVQHAIDTNIVGTINLVKNCLSYPCKFVYISSEYVFSGDRGDYSIYDKLDPKNIYGKTKAAAEYIVSTLPNYQIIRAPFVRKIHKEAFTDQYSSKQFLDSATISVINTIINNNNPIVHIAAAKKSLYDLYVDHGYDVQPILMNPNQLKILPKDTSLISNEYE